MSGEAFGEEHADAVFIVENADGTVGERAEKRRDHFAGAGRIHGNERRTAAHLRSKGEDDGEGGAARGERGGFNIATVLFNDGHADTEAVTCAAAGTLGGEQRIEETGDGFGLDANAIVLDGDANATGQAINMNLDAAGLADFANGLFGVGDEIQENLNKLIGVADDGRKSGERMEIGFDIVAAKRMFMELQSAIDDGVEIERLFLGRSGT